MLITVLVFVHSWSTLLWYRCYIRIGQEIQCLPYAGFFIPSYLFFSVHLFTCLFVFTCLPMQFFYQLYRLTVYQFSRLPVSHVYPFYLFTSFIGIPVPSLHFFYPSTRLPRFIRFTCPTPLHIYQFDPFDQLSFHLHRPLYLYTSFLKSMQQAWISIKD